MCAVLNNNKSTHARRTFFFFFLWPIVVPFVVLVNDPRATSRAVSSDVASDLPKWLDIATT